MYSRPQGRAGERSLRVPDNYNGCAFSNPPPSPPPSQQEPPPSPQAHQEALPSLQSDDWLLLGMILLLLRGETDAELILLLTFLLFCG